MLPRGGRRSASFVLVGSLPGVWSKARRVTVPRVVLQSRPCCSVRVGKWSTLRLARRARGVGRDRHGTSHRTASAAPPADIPLGGLCRAGGVQREPRYWCWLRAASSPRCGLQPSPEAELPAASGALRAGLPLSVPRRAPRVTDLISLPTAFSRPAAPPGPSRRHSRGPSAKDCARPTTWILSSLVTSRAESPRSSGVAANGCARRSPGAGGGRPVTGATPRQRQPGGPLAQGITRWPAPAFDKTRYRARNTVERAVNKLKQFRAVATRYASAATSIWEPSLLPRF